MCSFCKNNLPKKSLNEVEMFLLIFCTKIQLGILYLLMVQEVSCFSSVSPSVCALFESNREVKILQIASVQEDQHVIQTPTQMELKELNVCCSLD